MTSRKLELLNTVIIDRIEGRYISFPDVVRTRTGKLICGFRDADIHFPPNAPETELVLMDSNDDGASWHNRRVFDHYPRTHEQWAWHCVRFSVLSDGRIALVCDLAGPGFGEPVTHVSLSSDDGQTWTAPVDTGMVGILPDRLIEFGPDEWGFTSHWPDGNHFYQRLYATSDGGRTWSERGLIAAHPSHRFCEASVVRLPSTELVAYLRENSFLHKPTYACRSLDSGRTWSEPQPHPTHGHRPCAGLLEDGDMLVTYRSVGGNPGLMAWVGPSTESGFVPSGKDLTGQGTSFVADGFQISCGRGDWDGVEINLPPLDSWDAGAEVRARVRRVDGGDNSCVLRAAGFLHIGDGRARFVHRPVHERPDESVIFGEVELDTATFHDYTIRYQERRVQVLIDSVVRIEGSVGDQPYWFQKKIAFGNASDDPTNYVSFSHNAGTSVWASVSLQLRQPDGTRCAWQWDATSKQHPNHYERARCFQINAETGREWGDNGYSGWVPLGDGRVFCVDHRMGKASKPYVVGYLLQT